MAKKKKTYEDDDGRVIANMNVDGMPWFVREQRARKERTVSENAEQLTRSEERTLIWGAMKAGLLIAGVFILGALLFILFCLYVWF